MAYMGFQILFVSLMNWVTLGKLHNLFKIQSFFMVKKDNTIKIILWE